MHEEKQAKRGLISRLLEFFKLGSKKEPPGIFPETAEPKERAQEANLQAPEREIKAKKPQQKKHKSISKKAEKKLKKELLAWQKKVKKLTEKLYALEKQLKKKKIAPKKAQGEIKIVYSKLADESKDIDSEMKYTSALMKRLEKEYLKRHITESEFRQKMLDYREKQYLLQMKQQELKKHKKDANRISEMVGNAIVIQSSNAPKASIVAAMPVKSLQKSNFVAVPVSSSGGFETAKKPPIAILKKTKVNEKASAVANMPKNEIDFAEEPLKNSSKGINVVEQIVEHKAKGRIDEEKLRELEHKIESLVYKYNIPPDEIKKEVDSLDTKTLLESFNRLISLLELEHKAKTISGEGGKHEAIREIMKYGTQKDLEKELKGIAIELKKHRIVTDFDRILSLVNEKGSIGIGEISKSLNIEKKRVLECAEILEANNLVSIIYPAIGDPKLLLKGYAPKTKGEMQNA